MSNEERYYYLKLKDNFFDSDEMIVLENMKDGYLYCNILMKLYLRSLKNGGKLMLNDRIPYSSATLSSVVRHPEGVVVLAIKAFQELGLIEILDTGAIYMLDLQTYIGRSSTEADRKRAYRDRIESEKHHIQQITDKCPDESPDKNPPKKEIEKERKKEIEKKDKTTLFTMFWSSYPKKQNKSYSQQVFNKVKQSEFEHIMYSLERFKETREWMENDGKFIPMASTWLNQQRWLDFDMPEAQNEEYIPPDIEPEPEPEHLPMTPEAERMLKEALKGNTAYDYTTGKA